MGIKVNSVRCETRKRAEGCMMGKDIFLSLKNHFMAWIGKPVGSTKPISSFKVRTSYFGLL